MKPAALLACLLLTGCSYGVVYQAGPDGIVRATPLVRHCAIPVATPYGPDRVLCPMPQLLPAGAACLCPPPPVPPGYPPPAQGVAVP